MLTLQKGSVRLKIYLITMVFSHTWAYTQKSITDTFAGIDIAHYPAHQLCGWIIPKATHVTSMASTHINDVGYSYISKEQLICENGYSVIE